jgi:hypothetical protein
MVWKFRIIVNWKNDGEEFTQNNHRKISLFKREFRISLKKN